MGDKDLFRDLHILELGAGAAGPLASRAFVEYGATVVRIESRRRPDFLRLLRARPGDVDALEGSPMFAQLNPDKLSVALDLSHPDGVALALRLAGWADVVIENFAPGVMQRLGLDYERLAAGRQDLVMLSSSLFGQTGPQRHYPGFGGQGSALAGFNHQTGDADSEPHGSYGTITDTLSPRYAALLLAAALLERRRTGRGRYIDLSQIEAGVYSLAELVVRQSATGGAPARCGNRSENVAPHGIYPAAGEDAWVAIAVHDDDDWRRLGAVMGNPHWSRDARFADTASRRAHADLVDTHLGEWTCRRAAQQLAANLQEAGIDASPVQGPAALLEDPQLAHRGHFEVRPHAHLGELALDRSGFRLSETSGGFDRAGPALCAHRDEVLGEILGLGEEEIDRLEREGVLR